jgi:hypothetical protein
MLARSRRIGPIPALGHDAFKPHARGSMEKRLAFLAFHVIGIDDPPAVPCSSSASRLFRISSGSDFKFPWAKRKEIEGDQMAGLVMLSGMQQVEVSNPAIAFDDALSVQQEMLRREP